MRTEPPFELLETLKWDPTAGYVLLDRHLKRMADSAEYFGFRVQINDVKSALQCAIQNRRSPSRVRVLAASDGDVRCEVTDLILREEPWRVALAAKPVSASDVFLYHKTTRRAVHDEARASRPDIDAVLLWNQSSELTESVDANVVLEFNGRRVTPPLECGLLPGTMRAELLARGDISEQRVMTSDLARVEGIWLINSVRGWIEAKVLP